MLAVILNQHLIKKEEAGEIQNRAFLPTRLRNKEYCFFVGWGILRRKR